MNSVVTGITGKIGSGKTTLLSIFEKSDFLVINCDIFARTMIDNNTLILDSLRKTYGKLIFTQENTLDRSVLRNIVFNNKKELDRLNKITHPYLYSELEKFLKYAGNIKKNIVFEAAVMFEAGLNKLADNLIWIESDIDIIIKRVNTRDNEKINTIKRLYNNQRDYMDVEQFIDYIILNNSDVSQLEQEVQKIIQKIKI